MDEPIGEVTPLLGDLSKVAGDYLRDVSHSKRVLERWTMDPAFREAFALNPQDALDGLGVSVRPCDVIPLIDRAAANQLAAAVGRGEAPEGARSVRRYQAFIHEKLAHRETIRGAGESTNSDLAAWRRRQLNRCRGELGAHRAVAIVHAPMAIELSKGCTVGCWFCGVAAPRFEHTWPYPGDGGEWRSVLSGLHSVMGDCIQQGFLYWATDPLDNPDYERFLVDFHRVLGRCPQTTTAMGHKDIERSRALLEAAYGMGSTIDRFSVTTLAALRRIHDGFSAEELLRVELVAQNKEATENHRKSNAGRARRFAARRGGELVSDAESSTIACVSGFLLNMVERTVRMVTPCNASSKWPLGYWTLDQRTFGDAEELPGVLDDMIRSNARPALRATDVVRLRRDVTVEADGTRLVVASRGMRVTFNDQLMSRHLASLLDAGDHRVEAVAAKRRAAAGTSELETIGVLDELFTRGLLDEEPTPIAAEDPEPLLAIGRRT